MSMHKKPLTPLEEEGLRLHHLDIGIPSQLSDSFRNGMAWAQRNSEQDLPIHKANTDKLAELALYCVQRKIGRAGQEAHEAIMLHCGVLTAQLELMHQGVLLYLNNSITSKDEEVNWKKLVHILESNPQQCLTEIKAMAIEEAIGECLSAIDDNAAIKLVPFGYLLSEKWLLHYAEKIRRGDE